MEKEKEGWYKCSRGLGRGGRDCALPQCHPAVGALIPPTSGREDGRENTSVATAARHHPSLYYVTIVIIIIITAVLLLDIISAGGECIENCVTSSI
jgi:hypothetical protein